MEIITLLHALFIIYLSPTAVSMSKEQGKQKDFSLVMWMLQMVVIWTGCGGGERDTNILRSLHTDFFFSGSGEELGSLISTKTVKIKSVVKIQTLEGILNLKSSKHYAHCPGPQEKIWWTRFCKSRFKFSNACFPVGNRSLLLPFSYFSFAICGFTNIHS